MELHKYDSDGETVLLLREKLLEKNKQKDVTGCVNSYFITTRKLADNSQAICFVTPELPDPALIYQVTSTQLDCNDCFYSTSVKAKVNYDYKFLTLNSNAGEIDSKIIKLVKDAFSNYAQVIKIYFSRYMDGLKFLVLLEPKTYDSQLLDSLYQREKDIRRSIFDEKIIPFDVDYFFNAEAFDFSDAKEISLIHEK